LLPFSCEVCGLIVKLCLQSISLRNHDLIQR
jgi:hypothetical protein